MAEESVKPVIGSFSDPDEDVQIEDKRKEDNPSKNLVGGIEEALRDDIDESEEVSEKSKSYEEILAEAEIPLDDAHDIVDAMITQGHYEETLTLTKKSTVTFRTRSYADFMRYCRALEVFSPKYMDEQQDIMARYFLAGSLVAFKGRTFKHVNKADDDENANEAFNERLKWIESQPQLVIDLLVKKLNRFDLKVRTVMSEGVIENF